MSENKESMESGMMKGLSRISEFVVSVPCDCEYECGASLIIGLDEAGHEPVVFINAKKADGTLVKVQFSTRVGLSVGRFLASLSVHEEIKKSMRRQERETEK